MTLDLPQRHGRPFLVAEDPAQDAAHIVAAARIAVRGVGREAVPLGVAQPARLNLRRDFLPFQR
jgi:hypothetical protein